jgi:hypothetical protein
MKTTIEINGYVIEISEEGGNINVSAIKDEEVIEEFSLEVEGEDSDSEDVKPFGAEEEDDFGGEFDEDDLEDSEEEDEDDDDNEEEDEDVERLKDSALESFQSFINKKRK